MKDSRFSRSTRFLCCSLFPGTCSLLFSVRIHHDLSFVAKVYGLQILELLPPFGYVIDIQLVASEKLGIPQMDHHRTYGAGCDLYILRVGEIDFAQVMRVVRAV